MTTFGPVLALLCLLATVLPAQACDTFVGRVHDASRRYQAGHRISPVPARIRTLAIRHLPQLWISPGSWRPIDFADYLDQAVVKRLDDEVLAPPPSWSALARLPLEQQCTLYLDAPEITPRHDAPVYIQVYRDRSPVADDEQWTYIKYNLVFDWSGLPAETSLLSDLGVLLSGGDRRRWHRLDIHVSAVLAFDEERRLRLLTLAQHNYERTYLAGRDFAADRPIALAAARDSNELYLDDGSNVPWTSRVVPFFDDFAFLIDGAPRPWLWALDEVTGRHAGAIEVPLRPVFIAPDAPLAAFAGQLAPRHRLFGLYIGRDGPPGYDYYALPEGIPMPNLVAMGYWHKGDHDLVERLGRLMKGWRETDWPAVIALMRQRLAADLAAR